MPSEIQNKTNVFGDYIRALRLGKGLGQRELARILDISPSYLNDIERNKRVAPRAELITSLTEALGADVEMIFDLAGRSRETVPPDITDFVLDKPEVIALVRAIKNYNFASFFYFGLSTETCLM